MIPTEEQLKAMQISSPMLVEEVRRLRREVMAVRADREQQRAVDAQTIGVAVEQLRALREELARMTGDRDAHRATANLHATAAADAIRARQEVEERLRQANASIAALNNGLAAVKSAIGDRFWRSPEYVSDISRGVDLALKVAVRR